MTWSYVLPKVCEEEDLPKAVPDAYAEWHPDGWNRTYEPLWVMTA